MGQVVVALQEQQCADGTVRVQIDRGWVSKAAKGGAVILEAAQAHWAAEEGRPPPEPCGDPPGPAGGAEDQDARGVAGDGLEPYILPPYILYQALRHAQVRQEASAHATVVTELEEGDVIEVQGEHGTARDGGGRWVQLSDEFASGWVAELSSEGTPNFNVVLPIDMDEIEVDWDALPEAPFASLEEMPREGGPKASSGSPGRPGGGDGEGWLEDEDEDEDDEQGALLSATEAFAVDEIEKVPFPAKTLFIKDILSSPMLGYNMDADTVIARRKGLSAWLRAVHRIRPEEQLVRNFFLTNQYRL
eukprot:COSAG05_NODE_1563_length_4553_cov_12.689044_3_plen_304_part_00